MNRENAQAGSPQKTIWSFDLGKASIGEAVRDTHDNSFPHKESLLIPQDFAETKTAATRRRMWRTRQAHKAREGWLDAVMRMAGFEPLIGRRVEHRDGKWQSKLETAEQRRLRGLLEREFPAKGDPTCYNSALLRIHLLRGDRLEPWQIYKALHSAIQKRGYGRVPWAAREAKRGGKSEEEIEKEMQKKDPAYRAAVGAWPAFKQEVANADFHFPCYYDAAKMGLWNPAQPDALSERINCHAASTRKVRFDRADVEKEIATLACRAAEQSEALRKAFAEIKSHRWTHRDEQSGHKKHFDVRAADFGEFLVFGPAGAPSADELADFNRYLGFRTARGIHPGSADDWMGATAQKVPRFDNRIVNDCALLDGMQVCNVAIRYDAKNKCPYPESLLASEVTFLMKLKNTLVASEGGQRKLTVDELRKIFALITAEALAVPIKVKPRAKKGVPQVLSEADETTNGMKTWPARVGAWYALTQHEWVNKKGIKELKLFPITGHAEVKAPKTEGRSRFSRPALRLIRALILEGQKPSEFLRRLKTREPELLEKIGMDVLDAAPLRGKKNGETAAKAARPWILTSHLKFIEDLAQKNRKGGGDTWEDLHLPEQRIDALQARHTDDGIVDRDNAIRELLGSINDPVVRHRLGVFAGRLHDLHGRFGVPEQVVLEFVRTDFMGDKAKFELARFQNEREKARKLAREQADIAGATERSGRLKYELFAVQGSKCFYCEHDIKATDLANCDVDHIVPRSQGGPDAMVNFVLAHRHCNEAKGELTPFQWKHAQEGWHGYVRRVESQATMLRNKKVQLLLREDAPELVQRYTALAETAWISRLAQTVLSLHFGWQNGNDAEGKKRVTIVSGGLTGRVRRRYKLNSLLNPPPPGTTDLDEWEATAEKNRADDRHHALDAMVINFLPQWMRDEKKDHFFRFPEAIQRNPRAYFQREIDQVMPRNLAYEKAALAETIYGARKAKEGLEIVQRVPLRELAMKPIAPGKTKFDADYLRKQIKGVRDAAVAQALLGLLESEPDEAAWERFCADFHLRRRDGSPGPRVLRISVHVGEPTEYREMSKDGTGAWRKGLGSHQGQIIYWNEKGVLSVRPVFAHASVARERKAIESLGGQARFYGFFQSDCAVQTTKEIPVESYSLIVKNEAKQKRWVHAEHSLPPCRLTLRTIVTKTQFAEMTLANNTRVVAKLDVWVNAGLVRMK